LEALILCPDFRDTASTVYVITFKYLQSHAGFLCNIFTTLLRPQCTLYTVLYSPAFFFPFII